MNKSRGQLHSSRDLDVALEKTIANNDLKPLERLVGRLHRAPHAQRPSKWLTSSFFLNESTVKQEAPTDRYELLSGRQWANEYLPPRLFPEEHPGVVAARARARVFQHGPKPRPPPSPRVDTARVSPPAFPRRPMSAQSRGPVYSPRCTCRQPALHWRAGPHTHRPGVARPASPGLYIRADVTEEELAASLATSNSPPSDGLPSPSSPFDVDASRRLVKLSR